MVSVEAIDVAVATEQPEVTVSRPGAIGDQPQDDNETAG